MNTIPVIHLDQWVRREERLSLVNFNNSQLRKNQGQAPGTQPALCSPIEMSEGTSGALGRELAGALTDAGSGTVMSHWCPCSLPIEQGPGGQETTLPAPVCSISARYLSHSADRWRVLHQQPTMPVGDDLLISVWFLHPALIEIHTASLAWLSLA